MLTKKQLREKLEHQAAMIEHNQERARERFRQEKLLYPKDTLFGDDPESWVSTDSYIALSNIYTTLARLK